MNKFEENRINLDALMERLEKEGMSNDLEIQFENLCSETGIAIVLGPNESIKRIDKTEDREYADSLDLIYYNDTFSNIDYKPFLKDENLGEVELEYIIRKIKDIDFPILRITYEKKWLFFNAIINEEKRKEIDIKINFLSTVLGCKWYETRIETVRV